MSENYRKLKVVRPGVRFPVMKLLGSKDLLQYFGVEREILIKQFDCVC